MVPNCKVHGKEDATVPHNIRAGVEIRDELCIKATILFRNVLNEKIIFSFVSWKEIS